MWSSPDAAFADARDPEPWRAALRSPTDLRRLLAPRSAWAILALAAGDARFAARVADGLDAPEASRARARLKGDGLIAVLPLLQARAGRAWCAAASAADLARLCDDPRVLSTGHPAQLQGYVRGAELAALVDEYALHAAPNQFDQSVLLRPVGDPWPFADASAAVPALVQALDLIEADRRGGLQAALESCQADAEAAMADVVEFTLFDQGVDARAADAQASGGFGRRQASMAYVRRSALGTRRDPPEGLKPPRSVG